jgi:hypothetical protein
VALAVAWCAFFSPAAAQDTRTLVLRDGSRFEVTVLERRGKAVEFVTRAGQRFRVAEDQVVTPPLASIPVVGQAPPRPTRPVAARPARVKRPRPTTPPWSRAAQPVPMPGSLLFQSVPLTGPWDSGFPAPAPPVNGAAPAGGHRTPVLGSGVFLTFSGALSLPAEARSQPLPSGLSTDQPDSAEHFGRGEEFFTLPHGSVSAELVRPGEPGRPRRWALKATGVYTANYLRASENGIVATDPRKGRSRERQRASLDEAYGELELLRLGASGFISARAGLQPFLADPRGLIFADSNLGLRLFGQMPDGRVRFDVAYFDLLEKDSDTGLNTFHDRQQRVMAAGVSIPDVLFPGYTVSLSLLRNEDHASTALHYDSRGRLVRPAPVGTLRLHDVDVNYFGLVGQGRWGPLDVMHATYAAFGADRYNPIAARHKEVVASFFAVEASLPRGRARYRLGTLISSGEDEVTDKRAAGFDAIVDGSDFAGGPFSYWSRTSLVLPQTRILLKGPASLLPNLRSSRTSGQANFVNPGLILINMGAEFQKTPRLAGVLNANYLWFHNTDTLEQVLFQDSIDTSIGLDLGAGVIYRRPGDRLGMAAGITGLFPTIGFDDLFRSFCHVPGCGHGRKKLYNAFVEVRVAY